MPTKRPRLLCLNQYYWPAVEADGRLLTELCEGLADDWDVTVLTGTSPVAPAGTAERNGVRILRVPSTAFDRRRHSLRALNYASFFAAASARGALLPRPDVVLCLTNPFFVGDAGYALARRFGAALVAVVQDVFPDTAVALGELRDGILAGALDGVVRFYLHRADRVVAVGEMMRRRLEAKGVQPDRLRVIENWADTAAIRPEPRDNPWARKHGLDGRFVIMHSGNVGLAQDLDTLIEAAALLRDVDRLSVIVVGSGVRLAELRARAERLGAPVRFLPFQRDELVSQSLSSADVHVVGLARGLVGCVVPSRTYGVLAAGRPVIAAAEPESETARLVATVGCGLVVEPGRPDELAAAIRSAYEGEIDLATLGRRGRDYAVEHADRTIALSAYRELLQEARALRSPR